MPKDNKGRKRPTGALVLTGKATPASLGLAPEVSGFELKTTGMIIEERMPVERWLAMGQILAQMERSIRWWWGDWLAFGQRRYGEMYSQAVKDTGLSYNSLADAVWVSRRIELSRRRANLSWSHHRELAALPAEEQDYWLDRAETERLGSMHLREELRRTKRKGLPEGPTFGAPLNFRELRHEPVNEQGVVYLFGMVGRELGFLVEAVGTGYPDCTAKRRTERGRYVGIDVEFEFRSSNFREHGHDPAQCHLIVCWEHDWPDCPVEVLELRSAIKGLDPNV